MYKYQSLLISIIFLLLLFLTLGSCRKKELSSLVDQDDIYLDYVLSYNDFSNQTFVQARFFLEDRAGKRIRLSQNSRAFYGNFELESKTRRGTRYTASIDGYLSGEPLRWNDTEDREYVNYINIPSTIYVPPQTINSWTYFWGYDVYWQGDSIAPNEEVILRVEVDQDTSFSFEILERDQGQRHIHIPSWRMDDLIGYTADITITRRRFPSLQETPAAGGEVTASYISDGSWITVW